MKKSDRVLWIAVIAQMALLVFMPFIMIALSTLSKAWLFWFNSNMPVYLTLGILGSVAIMVTTLIIRHRYLKGEKE
jgi:uncharacterized integral membrane protein